MPSVAFVDGEPSVDDDERLAGVRRRGARRAATSVVSVDAGGRAGVAGGQDAPVHRREVRREQHLGAEVLLDLGRVAVVEQPVGGEVLVDGAERGVVLRAPGRRR